MAIITISEQVDGLGHEIATKTSQRLDFVLVDSTLISSKLNASQALDVREPFDSAQDRPQSNDEEKLAERVFQREIPPELIKKLIIKQALGNNVIILNLGGEILFRNFPGTLHVKIRASYDEKESRKLIRERERNYIRFIKELYRRQKLGSDFYDLQIKVENMDTDFAVDLIVKAAEIKGIIAKAGVTWRALEKLRASLEKLDFSPRVNEKVKHLAIPSFAHPSERDFARVLDFYRIKWEYEPRSFPIEWDKEGNVTERFTPDFYLPEHALYIELTTLKQNLVTRKNRKVRKLKELYPGINIKIFYGRDYKRLLQRFGIK